MIFRTVLIVLLLAVNFNFCLTFLEALMHLNMLLYAGLHPATILSLEALLQIA